MTRWKPVVDALSPTSTKVNARDAKLQDNVVEAARQGHGATDPIPDRRVSLRSRYTRRGIRHDWVGHQFALDNP
jgi:hypothetical protein